MTHKKEDFFEVGDTVEVIKGGFKGHRGPVIGTSQTLATIKIKGKQSYFREDFIFEELVVVEKHIPWIGIKSGWSSKALKAIQKAMPPNLFK